MNIDSIIKEEYKRIKKTGVYGTPNHYVINITDDDQKDIFLYELTSAMAKEGLRPFNALDRWLYFHLDGSKGRLLTYRGIIESSAVYDNYYEGVLAFDASALLLPVNRATRETFFSIVSSKDFSQHSSIVIFLNELTSADAKDFLYGLGKNLTYMTVEYKSNKMRLIYEK